MMGFLSHLAPGLLYPAIFIGILFTGGLTLMAAMYLAFSGIVSLPLLFLTTIGAAVFADTFWYLVGTRATKETIYEHKFIRSKVKQAKRFSHYFDTHGALLVFITKFVYGARLASHILAGVHRVNYPKFLLAVASGTSVWFGIFYSLVYVFNESTGTTKATALHIQLFFLVGIVFLLLFNWFTGTFIKKYLMRRRS